MSTACFVALFGKVFPQIYYLHNNLYKARPGSLQAYKGCINPSCGYAPKYSCRSQSIYHLLQLTTIMKGKRERLLSRKGAFRNELKKQAVIQPRQSFFFQDNPEQSNQQHYTQSIELYITRHIYSRSLTQCRCEKVCILQITPGYPNLCVQNPLAVSQLKTF